MVWNMNFEVHFQIPWNALTNWCVFISMVKYYNFGFEFWLGRHHITKYYIVMRNFYFFLKEGLVRVRLGRAQILW